MRLRFTALIAIQVLAFAACATAPAVPPDQRLRGCWIARAADGTAVTMRWLPDRERPEVLAGEYLRYGPGGAEGHRSFRLEPPGPAALVDAWSLCERQSGALRCDRVAEGEGGPLGRGRVFIDADEERLRIALHKPGGTEILFDGARDGCD